jgi:hypothetical protein
MFNRWAQGGRGENLGAPAVWFAKESYRAGFEPPPSWFSFFQRLSTPVEHIGMVGFLFEQPNEEFRRDVKRTKSRVTAQIRRGPCIVRSVTMGAPRFSPYRTPNFVRLRVPWS